MGKNKNAASDAASAANRASQLGVDELRRQFDITQENISPFIDAGTNALPGLIEGTTAGGLDSRLSDIFNTDIFGSLVDERQRGLQGQLAAGGLTRSGTALQEAANIPTELGLALEGLLTGRLGGLVSGGQNAATGLGQLGAQNSGSIADMFSQQGQNTASGILGDAQAASAGLGNILGGIGNIAGSAFKAGGIGKLASGIFFSDPRLKDNVQAICDIGNLSLVQWDWKPFCEGTIIAECGTLGFMADEVEEKYPHHVGEFGGWKIINYPRLLDEIEDKYLKEAA